MWFFTKTPPPPRFTDVGPGITHLVHAETRKELSLIAPVGILNGFNEKSHGM